MGWGCYLVPVEDGVEVVGPARVQWSVQTQPGGALVLFKVTRTGENYRCIQNLKRLKLNKIPICITYNHTFITVYLIYFLYFFTFFHAIIFTYC